MHETGVGILRGLPSQNAKYVYLPIHILLKTYSSAVNIVVHIIHIVVPNLVTLYMGLQDLIRFIELEKTLRNKSCFPRKEAKISILNRCETN